MLLEDLTGASDHLPTVADYTIPIGAPALAASFTNNPASGPVPLTVHFYDTSTGSPTSWSWTFGDSSGTSTSQNPNYTYNYPGFLRGDADCGQRERIQHQSQHDHGVLPGDHIVTSRRRLDGRNGGHGVQPDDHGQRWDWTVHLRRNGGLVDGLGSEFVIGGHALRCVPGGGRVHVYSHGDGHQRLHGQRGLHVDRGLPDDHIVTQWSESDGVARRDGGHSVQQPDDHGQRWELRPYTYAVTAGSLTGSGLSLSSAGVLSGASPVAGTYTFTVTATDTNNCTGSQAYSVTVQTQFGSWQQFYGLTGTLSGGDASYTGDGMSNTNKFMAGFNPTNAAAYLHVISIVESVAGNTNVVVTYLGANGDNSYVPGIASRTNVLDYMTGDANGSYTNGGWQDTGQTNILSGGNGSGIVTNMTDSNVTASPDLYYRVRVLLP